MARPEDYALLTGLVDTHFKIKDYSKALRDVALRVEEQCPWLRSLNGHS